MNLSDLTPGQLRRAADLKERIQKLQSELDRIFGGAASTNTATNGRRKKRKMSKSARAKIGAAQKARWAKLKGTAKSVGKPKPKRKMSAAARALISAAQKARWAKVKAAQNK